MVKLTRYNDNYWSLCRFPDKVAYLKDYKKHRLKIENNITDKEEIERISLSRTKNNIKNICLSNNFEYFMTVTVNSINADRFSLQEVQDKMKKICKKIRRRNYEFKYIFITERHKDGAFHFHGMCKSLNDLYTNKNGYLSSKAFDYLGFNSFDFIKNYNACCCYITKYITKDCVKNENNQIYFCSRGLSHGDSEYMIDKPLKEIFLNDKVFINDYCEKIDFEIDKLSQTQKTKLFEYFNSNDEIMQNYENNITNLLNLLTKTKLNII